MSEKKPPIDQDLWPADKVERWAISRLIPYARNSRLHSPAQIDQIAASIREWGWTVPVLVDEGGMIIAGHARVMAAQKLKIAQVPVMVAVGWPETKKRAYVIADNKLAMNSSFDNDMLVQELGDIMSDGFALDLMGFSEDDLALLLGGIGPGDGLCDPDDTPEPPAHPVSEFGDCWILGSHRLFCGDSTDENAVRTVLNGVKPHLMVTDPPYGVSYDPAWRGGLDKIKRATGKVENDGKADWREVYALFPGDVAYVWHAGVFSATVQSGLEDCGFAIRSQIIWAKPHFAIGRGDYHVQHEPCFYAVKKTAKGHWNGSRKESTIWQIANGTFQGGKAKEEDAKTGHGTQKPVECMRRPIENNSSAGHAIYEPFSGSGSTIIACEMTGRTCHAIELNPSYVDVAIKRWQTFAGKKAVLESSGRSYDEMAAERPIKA